MAFPKITYLDKVLSLQVPKEQNMVTVENINEIKHVVNSLSDGLDSLSGIISTLNVQEIYYINDKEFPSAGINSGLYINNEGEAKYFVDNKYINISTNITPYKPGNFIEITEDNTINVVLPKHNLEISGRYIVCHKDLS